MTKSEIITLSELVCAITIDVMMFSFEDILRMAK